MAGATFGQAAEESKSDAGAAAAGSPAPVATFGFGSTATASGALSFAVFVKNTQAFLKRRARS